MKSVKLNYKGFELQVNPSSVTLEMKRDTAVSKRLYPFNLVAQQNENPTVIRVKGRLTGGSAAEQAFRLSVLFKGCGSDYLFIPSFAPVKAYFTGLRLGAAASDGGIDYELTFIEDCSGKSRFYNFSYTYALEGENLYDIANRTGVSVEKLFYFNSFRDLFDVEEGDRVWLRQR